MSANANDRAFRCPFCGVRAHASHGVARVLVTHDLPVCETYAELDAAGYLDRVHLRLNEDRAGAVVRTRDLIERASDTNLSDDEREHAAVEACDLIRTHDLKISAEASS